MPRPRRAIALHRAIKVCQQEAKWWLLKGYPVAAGRLTAQAKLYESQLQKRLTAVHLETPC